MVTPLFLGGEEAPSLGEAGDVFGSITALFTGLAFAGFLLALFTQREDLKNQREELAKQREELALKREVFSVQKFENSLFNMLEMLDEHIATTEVPRVVNGHSQVVSEQLLGRAAIRKVSSVAPSYRDISDGNGPEPPARTVQCWKKKYQVHFSKGDCIFDKPPPVGWSAIARRLDGEKHPEEQHRPDRIDDESRNLPK